MNNEFLVPNNPTFIYESPITSVKDVQENLCSHSSSCTLQCSTCMFESEKTQNIEQFKKWLRENYKDIQYYE